MGSRPISDDDDKSQKTEEPTPHRLEKAQEKGQFAISKEVSHGFMLLAFMACIFIVFPKSFKSLIILLQNFMFNAIAIQGPVIDIYGLCKSLLVRVSWLFIFPALIIILTACIAGMGQTQFKISLQSVKPSFEKISILKGLKRIFSAKSLFDFFKSLIKFIIIVSVTYAVMASSVWKFINYPELDIAVQVRNFLGLLLKLLTSITIMIFLVALLDFFYERWNHMRNLRMTKQEVKDERKEMDGDPLIKGRIRQIRMERARRRMASEIPKATVIITNPTHYAVALKYEWSQKSAPIVLAKGIDFLAKTIRDIAKEHNIPIIENPPLARALYAEVKEGKEIPTDYYDAVAKIIRYIYNLKQRKN